MASSLVFGFFLDLQNSVVLANGDRPLSPQPIISMSLATSR